MRAWYVVLILCASQSTGCSMLIARCGKDLSVLNTQEEVRNDYGQPIASGVEEGKRYDDFHSHRKVVDEMGVAGLGMGLAMTCGIAEFWAFPLLAYDATKGIIVGQDLRFYYDDSGKVIDVKVNGHSLIFLRKRHAEQMNDLRNNEKTLPDGIKVPNLYAPGDEKH